MRVCVMRRISQGTTEEVCSPLAFIYILNAAFHWESAPSSTCLTFPWCLSSWFPVKATVDSCSFRLQFCPFNLQVQSTRVFLQYSCRRLRECSDNSLHLPCQPLGMSLMCSHLSLHILQYLTNFKPDIFVIVTCITLKSLLCAVHPRRCLTSWLGIAWSLLTSVSLSPSSAAVSSLAAACVATPHSQGGFTGEVACSVQLRSGAALCSATGGYRGKAGAGDVSWNSPILRCAGAQV